MRKLFFAICFNLLICQFAFSKVTEITSFESLPPVQQQQQKTKITEIDAEDFRRIVEEGFSKAKIVDPSLINKTTDYVSSAENLQEKEKSIFEKIYEQAINRISKGPQERDDVATPQILEELPIIEQQQQWQQKEIPTVMAELPPNNKMVEVPALEHIPYLMNFIEILPTGLVKFEETVVVVANGEKLRHGLTKILPTYIYSNKGKKQKLDYSIIDVTVNGIPVEYHLSSNGQSVLLMPDDNYELEPGIYTYKFDYVVNNLLWHNENKYQFYWDISGNGWNLVIDRLGAILNLPQIEAVLSQNILLGSAESVTLNAVETAHNGLTAYSYIARRPLFIGEGMHLIAEIREDALMPTTLWQKFSRFFYNNSDILLAFTGFLLVMISFIISWHYIAKDKGQLKIALSKTALILRYLVYDRFDIKSVCGFLLELYKKNIIDIQQSGEAILLIKRTDNLQSLTSSEKKAFKYLFPLHETVFSVTQKNKLPLKRFAAKLKQSLYWQMLKFRLKLNMGYLFAGLGIVLLTEVFISTFSYTPVYDFAVMSGATIICLAGICLWLLPLRWWLKIMIRIFSLNFLLVGLVLFSAVINPFAALFLIAALGIIVYSLGIYSRRRGLIRHYINDAVTFGEYLKKHHDTIVLGKDFLNYQPAIWVLDLENEFKAVGKSNEYDKLDVIKNIAGMF